MARSLVDIVVRREGRALPARPLVFALLAILAAGTVGVVALFASDRLTLSDAVVLVAVPWATLTAVLRPDWLLLTFIALPASLTTAIQTRRMLLLLAVALVALLVTRRSFSLGLGTGLVALLIVNVAGHVFQADVDPHAAALNQGTMLLLTYYILLALLGLNLALAGDLDGERMGAAILTGVMSTLVVGVAGYGGAWFESGPGIMSRTYLAALEAAALSVSMAPLFLPEEFPGRRLGSLFMTGVLLCLLVVSQSRASWLAAIITISILAFRSRRRVLVAILGAALLLALLAPTARQVVSRSESGDILAQVETGAITTGRSTLWAGLWPYAESALPWGGGFGYLWSLSSEDIFGLPGQFASDVTGFVPPHNDFVYVLVEFGILGIVLLAFFWVQLFRARRGLENSEDPLFRRTSWLLLGMLVSGFTFGMFDNLFLVRPIGERFFPVAGVVLGLGVVEHARQRHRVTSGPGRS